MITKIIKVYPLDCREYTDRNNQKQVFKVKAFILHDGDSSIYAEAIQQDAESLEALNPQPDTVVSVHLTCVCREYKTRNDELRYSNEFTIRKMMVL